MDPFSKCRISYILREKEKIIRQQWDLETSFLFFNGTIFAPLIFGFFWSGELEKVPVSLSYNNLATIPEVAFREEMNLHFTNLQVSSSLPWKPFSTLELHPWQTKKLVSFLAVWRGCYPGSDFCQNLDNLQVPSLSKLKHTFRDTVVGCNTIMSGL